MKLLTLLKSSFLLIILQQAASSWFLADFFFAHESSTADKLWSQNVASSPNDLKFNTIQDLLKTLRNIHCSDGILATPSFDKVVLIVVDALGSKFIPTLDEGRPKGESNVTKFSMPFLESSLMKAGAMGFTAQALTPTVTMPRIKALLSGSVPSFLDIVYNLAQDVSRFDEDNMVSIAKSRNKSIVFYGDDTWLSLFDRSTFTRCRETYSLFASDYTTVDTNVTEMAIPETELEHIDWDYMMLHYIGLDHIGHVFGSNEAELIKPKLLEMDSVIKQIHSNLERKPHRTLMIVCGDHGMSEEGNHGGGSSLEVNTAIVFLPINKNTSSSIRPFENLFTISQIDVAVTVSLLMGLPIPRVSKGVVIEPVLEAYLSTGRSGLLCGTIENLLQLVKLKEPSTFESAHFATKLIELLKRHLESPAKALDEAHLYIELSRELQTDLLHTVTSKSNPIVILMLVTIITMISLISLRRTSIRLLFPTLARFDQVICLAMFAIPIFMQGSTDFIESEQWFWPFFSFMSLLLVAVSGISKKPYLTKDIEDSRLVLLIISFITSVCWNAFKLSRGSSVWSTFFIPLLSVIILCNNARQASEIPNRYLNIIMLLLGSLIIYTKHVEDLDEFNNSSNAVVYKTLVQNLNAFGILLYTAFNAISSQLVSRPVNKSAIMVRRVASGWMMLTFVLSRRYNFVFLVSNIVLESSLSAILTSLRVPLVTRTILYVNFAYSAFYCQGNSNLFSSLDVKPAFFGQTSYNIYIAVPLVALATYSTQIYWYLKLLQRIQEARSGGEDSGDDQVSSTLEALIKSTCDFISLRNFLSFSYFVYVSTVLKNHLFIWSVISPKLVYHYVGNWAQLIAIYTISSIIYRYLRYINQPTKSGPHV